MFWFQVITSQNYLLSRHTDIVLILGTQFSVQLSSVAQSCPTLCDPICSTPGLPVHHQLPKFTQTHVHRVSDAIQPCHPLSSPSPPAPNPSQHHSLFQWVNSSHEQNTEKQINRKKKKKNRWKEGILMPLIFMSHNYLTHYKCQLWMLLINVWINEFNIHDELILKICIYYNISIHIFWNSLYVIIFIILQHLWTGKIEYIHPNLSQSSF